MKFIDKNGRLFGRISVIDVLVIAVAVLLGAALYVKTNHTTTGSAVAEETISFQIRATGLKTCVADALREGDVIYDLGYNSGDKPLGTITEIQVLSDPGTEQATFSDGTIRMVEKEDSVDLLITVESTGVYVDDDQFLINRVYSLGLNCNREYYTPYAGFIGKVAAIL